MHVKFGLAIVRKPNASAHQQLGSATQKQQQHCKIRVWYTVHVCSNTVVALHMWRVQVHMCAEVTHDAVMTCTQSQQYIVAVWAVRSHRNAIEQRANSVHVSVDRRRRRLWHGIQFRNRTLLNPFFSSLNAVVYAIILSRDVKTLSPPHPQHPQNLLYLGRSKSRAACM